MINSPIRESQKLLDSISGMFEGSSESKFNLLDEQIAAKNVIYDKIRQLKGSSNKSLYMEGQEQVKPLSLLIFFQHWQNLSIKYIMQQNQHH